MTRWRWSRAVHVDSAGLSVQALLAEGARVAVNSRGGPLPTSSVVADRERAAGDQVIQIAGDVSREADVAAMFDAAERCFGTVDVLINNAAVCPTCPVTDMSLDMWTQTLAVDLTGAFLTCREMVRRLIAAGRPGRIVNVSSTAAFLGSTTGHAPYDASKGGIVALTVSLAREVAAHGIAVNAVAPGMIRTDMTDEDPAGQRSQVPGPHSAATDRGGPRDRRCHRVPGLRAGQLHDRRDGQCQRRDADALTREEC